MKKLSKHIEEISCKTGKDRFEIFADFLEYIIFVMGVKPDNWPYDKEISRLFYAAFTDLCLYYEKETTVSGWCDPLGGCFEELRAPGDKSNKGQFFTPHELCDQMAMLTYKPATDERKVLCGAFGRRQLINDSACGSGRTLLSYAAQCADHKTKMKDMPYFVGEDIDRRCVKMTAINLAFHGLFGEVVCHDALSQPDTCSFGYVINETMWPLPCNIPSIRMFTNPDRFVLFRTRYCTAQKH